MKIIQRQKLSFNNISSQILKCSIFWSFVFNTYTQDVSLFLSYIIVRCNSVIKRVFEACFWSYHSNPSLEEDELPHELPSGDHAYWEGSTLKTFGLTSKDSYQALITSSCTVTLKAIDSWDNSSHWRGACAWNWPIESLPTSNPPENNCQTRASRRRPQRSTDGPGSRARPVSPVLELSWAA